MKTKYFLIISIMGVFLISATAYAQFNVTSIPSNPDITAASGTPYASIGLPTSTVAALENSSTTTLPILWNTGTPPYDPNTPGTYAFSGNLFLLGSTTNTNNLTSSVNVIVSSSTATSTATSTPPTATTTPSAATTTPSARGAESSGISGHRRDISSLLSPQAIAQGQVLGTSTSAATLPSDIRQQLISAFQQLINLLQRLSANLTTNTSY